MKLSKVEKDKKEKGSAFLEALVTMAIVGIVFFVVFVSFEKTKESVRINNIQSSLGALVATALACLDSGKELNEAYIGDHICESSTLLWPSLPDDWKYTETSFDIQSGIFSFGAKSDIERKEITCNQKGCVLAPSDKFQVGGE